MPLTSTQLPPDRRRSPNCRADNDRSASGRSSGCESGQKAVSAATRLPPATTKMTKEPPSRVETALILRRRRRRRRRRHQHRARRTARRRHNCTGTGTPPPSAICNQRPRRLTPRRKQKWPAASSSARIPLNAEADANTLEAEVRDPRRCAPLDASSGPGGRVLLGGFGAVQAAVIRRRRHGCVGTHWVSASARALALLVRSRSLSKSTTTPDSTRRAACWPQHPRGEQTHGRLGNDLPIALRVAADGADSRPHSHRLPCG